MSADGDGDKILMTYGGHESGMVEWIGGAGKYKDIAGSGTWTVADAPGNTSGLFAFALSYDVKLGAKGKVTAPARVHFPLANLVSSLIIASCQTPSPK